MIKIKIDPKPFAYLSAEIDADGDDYDAIIKTMEKALCCRIKDQWGRDSPYVLSFKHEKDAIMFKLKYGEFL